MAKFIGTQEEFIKFIGGYARNKVQYITAPYRKSIHKCENCGSKKDLQAAHTKGRERIAIIADILSDKFVNQSNIIELDLQEFEEAFVNAHKPIKDAFKILCRSCHLQYDKPDVIDFEEEEPIIDDANKLGELLRTPQADVKNKPLLIKMWSEKPFANHHKTIGQFIQIGGLENKVSAKQLIDKLTTVGYTNAYGTVHGLMSDGGRNYGKIFEEENDVLKFTDEALREILKYSWSV